MPYTTIRCVLVWNPATGVTGWDWLWVLLGVGLDIMKWGQIINKRKEVPGYPKEAERAMSASGPRPTEARQPLTPDQEAELEKLEDLRDKGVISGEEYVAKKRQIEGYE